MTPSPELDTQNLTRRCHEALILAVVEEGPHHGYQLALEIEERSRGYFRFNHGTLYPILHKLESEGLIVGAWDASSGGRRRRQYSLTDAGGERVGELRMALGQYFEALLEIIGKVEG